jgi:hypothetical protein
LDELSKATIANADNVFSSHAKTQTLMPGPNALI